MSKPPNTTAQPNTVIQSAMFNSVIDDLITDANFPRPVVAGGTGGTSQSTAQAGLGVDKKFVVTSTTGLTADATHNNGLILVTTTATIALTAAGTLGSGWHSFVSADGGIATIDPNGSQKINGALNLVLQDGQAAFVYCTNISGDEFSAIVFNAPKRPYAEKSANYTVVAADNDGDITFTAAATAAFTAAATLGTSFRVKIRAVTGDVILDPNGAEQIVVNGISAETFILKSGQTATVTGNGTLFYADVTSDTLQGPQLQGYYTGLAVTTNAGDATNDVDIAVGSAAADASPYYLMQLTSALTKRADALWAVGNNQGALDTGVIGNSTYYVHEIQRPDTGVTDALISLSLTAPTMPANYTRKRAIATFTRTAGANGAPVSLLATQSDIRAFVQFDGTGTPTVGRSRNVSSVVRNTTGTYTINFTTPMPSTTFATFVGAGTSASTATQSGKTLAKTVNSVQILVTSSSGNIALDMSDISVTVMA
jgi:hypothetical protein